MDVKKVGRIPTGGGWCVHGRDTDAARASRRGGCRAGYTYLHSMIDGFSRLAPAEALGDERATTTIAFFARAFFEANGIGRITRLVTDNGSAYRSSAFNDAGRDLVGRRQCTRPYTPRHSGEVECYNRILAEEFLHARPFTSEEQRRNQLGQWLTHYNYHRPHTATAGNPPASRPPPP